jgi:hypothetical protein
MTPTPTKPPRLPKGQVVTLCNDRVMDAGEKRLKMRSANDTIPDYTPAAIIPCKSAREAKQLVALHKMHADLPALLQQCDTVLTMVPHRGRDDGYMKIFGEEYVTPLVHKLRGTTPEPTKRTRPRHPVEFENAELGDEG